MRTALFAIILALSGELVAQDRLSTPTKNSFADIALASRTYPRSALPQLAKAPDSVVRQCAVMQIAETEALSADEVSILIAALGDSDERVRLQAMASLGRHGSVATRALLRALEDERPLGELKYASEAMNGMRTLSVALSDLVFAALQHSRELDTDAVLQAYSGCTVDAAAEPTHRCQEILMLLRKGPITFVPALTAALSSPDSKLASTIAARLGGFGEDAVSAASALETAAEKHAADDVREAASQALTRMGSAGHAALGRLAKSEQRVTRAAALLVLPLETTASSELVTQGLRDSEPTVRSAALARIAALHAPRAVHASAGHVTDEATARAWLRSLAPETPLTVRALLTDESSQVREAAVAAQAAFAALLPERGAEATESIVSVLGDEISSTRLAASRSLSELSEQGIWPSATAAPGLTKALRQTPSARLQLLQVLAGVEVEAKDVGAVVEAIISNCVTAKFCDYEGSARALMASPATADAAVGYLRRRLRRPAEQPELLYLFSQLESQRPAFRQAAEALASHRATNIRVVSALLAAKYGTTSQVALNTLTGAATGKLRWENGSNSDAALALVQAGDQGVERMLDILNSDQVPSETKNGLLRYGLGSAVHVHRGFDDWILATAAGADPALQAEALNLSAALTDRTEELRRVLQQAMKATPPSTREAALRAWIKAKFAPKEIMRDAFSDTSPAVRSAAIDLLRNLASSDAEALDLARAALRDESGDVRERALFAVLTMSQDTSELLAEAVDEALALGTALPQPYRLRSQKPVRFGPRLSGVLERRAKLASGPAQQDFEYFLERAASPRLQEQLRARWQLRMSSSDPDERARAAQALLRMNEALWTGDGRLRSVLLDTTVMKRMHEHLADTLDDLHPPGMAFASAWSSPLPAFPWPAPAGYSAEHLSRSLLRLNANSTLGAVYDTLIKALGSASTGFTQGLFSVRGGFALLARMERTDATGRPLPGKARWIKQGSPVLSLSDFLADLFFERPGYFRVIAFVFTDDPNAGSDPNAVLPEPEQGARIMPAALASQRLEQQELLALVYSFERKNNAVIQQWKDGVPSPREHLEFAGIWAGLRSP